jgi:hypothetical protein
MSRNKELEEQGWVKQFTTAEPRLSEVVQLYQSLGFEVHLEPMTPGEGEGLCQQCIFAACDYQTIYTRKKGTHQE